MSFSEAISSALRNYVSFSGRAVRSEYWYFVLFLLIVGIVAELLDFFRRAGRGLTLEAVDFALQGGALAVVPEQAQRADALVGMGRAGGIGRNARHEPRFPLT